ncbi:leucine--tRNA ligase [Firmicutes bacterium CAG:582]|nr:leucine--tRNA ligase [Firmicutes bacterium CAG:582]
MEYNFKNIEKKWQKYWYENHTFEVKNEGANPYYILVEFPYPSGAGLHVGHVRSYTAQDAMARMKRMQGYNVLYPMGFDAFGAPAEEYAIKNHVHPKEATRINIDHFRNQMKSLGMSFDWSREFSTTDPEYYKWTQWQFLQFYKHGMAYKDTVPVNWCPKCKMVLSNEDAAGGVCERCGTSVVQKEKSQWMLRMSDYAEDLLTGLEDTHFAEKVKLGQINWIGKSTGVEMDVNIVGGGKFSIFTTCIETVYGITFFVIAPDGKLIKELLPRVENKDEVMDYIHETEKKSAMDRTELNKGKTGCILKGIKAINPVNGREVPVFLGDFVLGSYGTGAVMAVPSHDQRDFEYAVAHNLEMIQVIDGADVSEHAFEKQDYLGVGCKLINSEEFTGLTVEEAKKAITKKLESEGIARRVNNYKMRDWIFSRQRFWGEPIPMINCPKCGWVPMNESDLPLVLPDVAEYEPTDDGESPLAKITSWVNTKCPKCGGDATRETDTMPQWAGSSWYFLRFMDAHNSHEFASMDAMKYWGKVNWYNGGMEHTARHLLYARFWVQMLYNFGLVPNKEMIDVRVSHGMILGSDNQKMSKSKGNVINPDDIVNEYGADTLRTYEMFMGDYQMDAPWNTDSLKGCKRFIDRVIKLGEKLNDKTGYSNEVLINKTIDKVSNDLVTLKYNTAVSALMILLNELDSYETITKDEYRLLLTLLNPIAPHITEELNEYYALGDTICKSSWPVVDKSKLVENETTIGVQVNGKVRGTITVLADETEDEIKEKALSEENVKKHIEGKEIVKVIVIKGRIVNIVVK